MTQRRHPKSRGWNQELRGIISENKRKVWTQSIPWLRWKKSGTPPAWICQPGFQNRCNPLPSSFGKVSTVVSWPFHCRWWWKGNTWIIPFLDLCPQEEVHIRSLNHVVLWSWTFDWFHMARGLRKWGNLSYEKTWIRKVVSTGHDPHIYHFMQIPLPLALGLSAMVWLNLEGLTFYHWKPPFDSLFQILSL